MACFHIDPVYESRGTAAVRGNKGFTHGKHYWEVKLSSVYGTSVMVGVCTKEAALETKNYEFVNLLGKDDESWGLSYKGTVWHSGQSWQYCEPFYDSTVIGILLDMDEGTLTFYKNGKSLGIAFYEINKMATELFPTVSSTATLTEIELQRCSCRYQKLQDLCLMTVRKHVSASNIDSLTLPPTLQRSLKQCI